MQELVPAAVTRQPNGRYAAWQLDLSNNPLVKVGCGPVLCTAHVDLAADGASWWAV